MTLGDYNAYNIRASAILTTSYVAGTILAPNSASGNVVANPSQQNQLELLVKFTIGSLTDAQIKIEFSTDGVTYYQETFSAISAGVDTLTLGIHKMTTTGNYRISTPIKDNYIKISAIGTGTVTSSLLQIDAVLGTV